MATKKRTRRTRAAFDAYLDAANESVTLVLAILDALQTGAEQQARDESNWSLVRSLGHANKRLREILESLGESE